MKSMYSKSSPSHRKNIDDKIFKRFLSSKFHKYENVSTLFHKEEHDLEGIERPFRDVDEKNDMESLHDLLNYSEEHDLEGIERLFADKEA